MKLRIGPFRLGSHDFISMLALYLLSYHLVFSGIITYNQSVGNLPEIPYLSVFFFGPPFLIFASQIVIQWLRVKASITYTSRNFLFFILVIYIAIVILSHYHNSRVGNHLLVANSTILMWYVISYFIGLGLKPVSSEFGRRMVLVLFALLVLNVLLNTNIEEARIFVNYDYLGLLLFLGDCFAIWSILALSQNNNNLYIIPIAISAIVCLYLISSRSSLYAFVGVLPLIAFRHSSKQVRYALLVMGIALFLLLLLKYDYFTNSRMLGFLLTGEDRSVMLRGIILDNNLKDLWEHWFLGQYAGHLHYGPFGNYIHNYLSLWRQFGLIPFLLFLILTLPLIKFIFEWVFKGLHREHNFLVYLSVFSLIEIVFTRSYTYGFIWIAIGQMTRISRNENVVKK